MSGTCTPRLLVVRCAEPTTPSSWPRVDVWSSRWLGQRELASEVCRERVVRMTRRNSGVGPTPHLLDDRVRRSTSVGKTIEDRASRTVIPVYVGDVYGLEVRAVFPSNPTRRGRWPSAVSMQRAVDRGRFPLARESASRYRRPDGAAAPGPWSLTFSGSLSYMDSPMLLMSARLSLETPLGWRSS